MFSFRSRGRVCRRIEGKKKTSLAEKICSPGLQKTKSSLGQAEKNNMEKT